MVFDVIIGNPPYQRDDGGGKRDGSSSGSSTPVYNKFVELARLLNPHFLIMIIPAKWYSGGRNLEEFRESMLTDRHIKTLVDIEDSRECFENVDIAGGVCYFLWDKSYASIYTNVISLKEGVKTESKRVLDELKFFIRDSKTAAIVKKIMNKEEDLLEDRVLGSRPFGIRSNEIGEPNAFEGCIRLYGSTGITYISKDRVKNNKSIINDWKVVVSKAANERAGQTYKIGKRRVLSKALILPPGTVCTESYLVLDTFNSPREAESFLSYVKTNFFRFLLSTVLMTQNIAKDKFCFIPIQKYNEEWTDNKLYEKYNLAKDEINYINSKIREL